MKVLIVNNMAPFLWGGAEELAAHLQKNLIIAGHEAEILRIPFQWEPASCIPSQMLMVRSLELRNVDHVIALKFPAYLIRHPKKTLWLLHQYRQAYDLYEIGQTNLSSDIQGNQIRNLIKRADDESFAECRQIFTNSEVTSKRLTKYNGFNSKVLFPPINDPEIFIGGRSEGYIFAAGRINIMKRQHLLLEAMRRTAKNVKLLIAGPPDTIEDGKRLMKLVEQLNLSNRVKLDLRFLPRETYADYVNKSAAIAYLPYDEDSLGYVAMEAAIAGKALITTKDSGGVVGLVKHKHTGWLVEPNAKSLASAMNAAAANYHRANKFGTATRELWLSFGVTWSKTLEVLLS